MSSFLARVAQRRNQFFRAVQGWFIRQVTWRNIVRAAGLVGMMYLVLTKDHPDATALVALGTMIGLPTFFWLQPAPGDSQSQQQPPEKPKRPGPWEKR